MVKDSKLKVEVTKDSLVIILPLIEPPKVSKSQKSLVIATTHGNVISSTLYKGKPIVLGVNAYIGKG